jgi:hypothetical protein
MEWELNTDRADPLQPRQKRRYGEVTTAATAGDPWITSTANPVERERQVTLTKQLLAMSQAVRSLGTIWSTYSLQTDAGLIKQLMQTASAYSQETTGRSGHNLGKPEVHLAMCCLRHFAKSKEVGEARKVVNEFITRLEAMQSDKQKKEIKKMTRHFAVKQCYDARWTNITFLFRDLTLQQAVENCLEALGADLKDGKAPASALERTLQRDLETMQGRPASLSTGATGSNGGGKGSGKTS